MTLNYFTNGKNKFCAFKDLTNESTVEDFFITRLLKDLGYKDEDIKRKESIEELTIPAGGRKKEQYRPDYVCFILQKPRIIIDAKAPGENVDAFHYQVSGYALTINQQFKEENPAKYCVLSNGVITKVYEWDKKEPILILGFSDFTEGKPKYTQLRETLSYASYLDQIRKKALSKETLFEFKKPPKQEIIGIFRACHNLIWKSEKKSPIGAFFEFVKLIFVKLRADKRLRQDPWVKERILEGRPLPKDYMVFSKRWIEREEKEKPNPIDEILFDELCKELAKEYKEGTKKRIFDDKEKIDLKPSTIKRVVELLEHYDLFGVDEDLNGKLFETFLSATMRGKALGQFFTPRPVVEFMTKMAKLRADKEHIGKVLDACCGTAGFLIEAMAQTKQQIEGNPSLTDVEKNALLNKLKEECLYGIDVGKGPPPIVRIARINMYLHGDGGSKIFFMDSLDKKMTIEKGMDPEIVDEITELKEKIFDEKLKFDVVLTNPPFAMRYSKKDKDQKLILKQYDLAYKPIGKDASKKIRSSLRSSVMFIERYYELLKPHGKLLTIMDESVLNTKSNKVFRDYIKDKFIIRAVISLPKNTFVNTGSGVKTSVLYLVKKEQPEEKQPKVFMAISQNVGHTDSGKLTPETSDLDNILVKFREFELGQFP